MARITASKERFATSEYTAKGFVTSLAVLGLVCTAAWFGYAQIFTKGLERLPPKVCDGAVDRQVVIRTLPRTRTAEEGASQRYEREDLMFSCHVRTSAGSILSGMARVEDASVQQWLNHYGTSTDGDAVRVSIGGVEASAELDSSSGSSSIYIPCVPRGVRAEEANESYAIIAEAGVIGNGRFSGAKLRQAVTDFTYQLTKHTYALAECRNPRTLPEELPRYEDHA
ncbi:hypothetical protein [Streptomyces sp. AK010]|uniref:hypothetical protein n=1 Tax=Streptomyces sp. AK010 TaxID=2723074 RepID=UPI001615C7CC|nr:hypothetical protein [Streptomyces sp. AK010]MBB6418415.1 hypothetical protein [Streptomyces sp. AK010]